MVNSTKKYQDPFEKGHYLHIYNRANSNHDLLFYNTDNYKYFLEKYDQYLSSYLDTLAYCLIPNHFHLMVKVTNDMTEDLNKSIIEQFRRFFITYSQAINKQEGRRGSLFQKGFKRKYIEESTYFTQLIFYIHFNPVHHNVSQGLENYRWSSYKSIISNNETKILRDEVLEWFGGKNNFITFHTNYQWEKISKSIIIEN